MGMALKIGKNEMKQNEIKKKIGAPLIFYFWGGGGHRFEEVPRQGMEQPGPGQRWILNLLSPAHLIVTLKVLKNEDANEPTKYVHLLAIKLEEQND